MKLTVDGKTFDVSVGGDEITVDGRTFRVRTEGRGPRKTVYVDEQPFRIETPDDLSGEFQVNVDAKLRSVKLAGAAAAVRRAAPAERRAAAPKAAVKGGVVATMAGRILRVAVEEGQAVQSGDLLLIFEAMKMENELRATHGGMVTQIAVKIGDRVNAGDLLMVIE